MLLYFYQKINLLDAVKDISGYLKAALVKKSIIYIYKFYRWWKLLIYKNVKGFTEITENITKYCQLIMLGLITFHPDIGSVQLQIVQNTLMNMALKECNQVIYFSFRYEINNNIYQYFFNRLVVMVSHLYK
jgi:hypothetical protein